MVDGKLPQDAMIGGFENEHIYIARAYHDGSLCPGKYVKSAGKAFVPWGGSEHCKEVFEILCGFNAKWVKTSSNYIPHNAIIGGRTGGYERNDEPLYIARAKIGGSILCGKAYARYNLAYLPYKGKEIEMPSYEILVAPDDEIPQALPFTSNSSVLPPSAPVAAPMNAAPPGYPGYPGVQPAFNAPSQGLAGIGTWVDASGGDVPPDAVVGGQDCNGEPVYVARAQHEGALLPGKLCASDGCAFVPWGGEEHEKPTYQVLVGGSNNWVRTSGSNVPPGAFPGGQTEDGEPLFVGRVYHEDNLITGKVQQSHGVCYISFEGEELSFDDYEVLMA
ncbi:hypothetical protein PYW07_006999 [Mythimna separata]|uniref:Uncharacterized protein n=1 Tax=Mythimna separata TaxID=271217 RepID=A0AAD7YZS1_MYTSE|nr:hypothetical protein PYW07_006999 [Mythimna separata]